MDLTGLLREITEETGVSGHEHVVADRVETAFKPLADEVRRDKLGNVIALKRGEQAGQGTDRLRIMLAAHMDEIGLMVTKVEDKGFIRFTQVGGIDPRTLPGQQVILHTSTGVVPGVIGVKSPHLTKPEDRDKAYTMEKLFIDIGYPVAKVKEMVRVGDLAVIRRQFVELAGESVAGKAMDDRAGVAAVYACMKELEQLRHQADVYAVATVQEEVGVRGAITSSYGVIPDMGIAVDVCHGSFPGVPEYETSGMGKGAVITVGPNIHPKVGEYLIDTAKKYNISYQVEAEPGPTGTDAWAIQITRAGIATGLISLPLRYMHTSVELLNLKDVRAAGRLMAMAIAGFDTRFREGLYCY